MDKSLLNYQFYKSFRMPIHKDDKVFIKIIRQKDSVSKEEVLGEVININLTGLNFSTTKILQDGEDVRIFVYTKRLLNNWDFEVTGKIVRSFFEDPNSQKIVYGVLLDPMEEDSELAYFLKDFINRFSTSRLKEYLLESAVSEKKISAKEGIELYSLMSSLYITTSKDPVMESLITATEILDCELARIYKINLDSHSLENIHSSNNELVKDSDYRHGLIGNVFTSSSVINLDLRRIEKHPYNAPEMRTTLAHPLYNRQHKTIGVIEFLNKNGGKKFSIKDERFIKLIASLISHHFDDFVPHSRITQIEELNPIEKTIEDLYMGTSLESIEIRKIINSLKTKTENILIVGEDGVGKVQLARGIHAQGSSALQEIFHLNCDDSIETGVNIENNLINAHLDVPGAFLLEEPGKLTIKQQKALFNLISRSKKRILTVSSKDLQSLVESGHFLKKLYFYLSKAHLHLRPLRNRKDEIMDIVHVLVKKEAERREIALPKLDSETIDRLVNHSWPGNMKELHKTIKKAMMKYDPSMDIYIDVMPIGTHHRPQKNTKMFDIINRLALHSDRSIYFDNHKKILNDIIKRKIGE